MLCLCCCLSLYIQWLIEETKNNKKVSVCVVTCLVYVHNSQDTASTLLTTSVTSSRRTGVMVWLRSYYMSSVMPPSLVDVAKTTYIG